MTLTVFIVREFTLLNAGVMTEKGDILTFMQWRKVAKPKLWFINLWRKLRRKPLKQALPSEHEVKELIKYFKSQYSRPGVAFEINYRSTVNGELFIEDGG